MVYNYNFCSANCSAVYHSDIRNNLGNYVCDFWFYVPIFNNLVYMMEHLLEKTEGFPNHSYIVNAGSTLLAFRPNGAKEWKTFTPGMNNFSKSGRKFDKLPVPKEFNTNVRESGSQECVKVIVGSQGDKYYVNGGKCSCMGFKFRGKCKHVSGKTI